MASLKYLRMGGRLSHPAAMLGTILHIKPILSIQGEQVDVVDKVRGIRTCERKMIEPSKTILQDDLRISRRIGFGSLPPEHCKTKGISIYGGMPCRLRFQTWQWITHRCPAALRAMSVRTVWGSVSW